MFFLGFNASLSSAAGVEVCGRFLPLFGVECDALGVIVIVGSGIDRSGGDSGENV
jgi:hypothetical protein